MFVGASTVLLFLLALTGGKLLAATNAPIDGANDPVVKLGDAHTERSASKYTPISAGIVRKYTEAFLDEGYFFVGLAAFPNGTRPPESVPDPDVIFWDYEINSLGLIKSDGRGLMHGPIEVLWMLYSGRYFLKGGRPEGYRTATFTKAWANNLVYCNDSVHSDAILAFPCQKAVFKWPLGPQKKNIQLFDPDDLNTPILSLNGVQEWEGIKIWAPPTDVIFWPYSPLRLLGMDSVGPLVDGVKEDGSPNIVDHVMMDVDFGGPVAIAWVSSITGPAAKNMVGQLLPLGAKFDYACWIRAGFIHVPPEQLTW